MRWNGWPAAGLAVGLAMAAPAQAEAPRLTQDAIREARTREEPHLLGEFTQLLAIPNLASDRDDIRRNAEAIAAMLRERGLQPELLGAPDASDAPPLVFAEWKVKGAHRTLVLYAHYDGQPVNPRDWTAPPFQPVLKRAPGAMSDTAPDARVFARSAGDDKGGVMAILGAIDVIRALHATPTDNLKIVFEGEEEAGSPHLNALLKAHADQLRSDLWIVCDGPVHPSGRVQVIYGARGDMNVDLTVYGPSHPLHSGHYGNWAPNPALRLAQLLASMKDADGRVTIDGWYDDIVPLGRKEQQAIDGSAKYDDAVLAKLGLAAPESRLGLAASATEPSLNINGLHSADVGDEAANVIPAEASAVLDVRLVAGETPQKQFERLQHHLTKAGYLVLDRPPTMEERLRHPRIARLSLRPGVYTAARTAMDHPSAASVVAAVRTATDGAVLELPSSGASLPLSVIKDSLGAPGIAISIANDDDNQHAADENLRLGNLWAGVDLFAAVLLRQDLASSSETKARNLAIPAASPRP